MWSNSNFTPNSAQLRTKPNYNTVKRISTQVKQLGLLYHSESHIIDLWRFSRPIFTPIRVTRIDHVCAYM